VPYFITNAEKRSAEFETSTFLLHEKKLSGLQAICRYWKPSWQVGRPLSSSPRRRGRGPRTLVVNRLRGGLKVAAVKAPGFGDRRKAMLKTSRS